MRKYSKSTPPSSEVQPEKQTDTISRTYKLLTPLYGRGVEPYQCDPITIIRPSEIRGHLRFWWRACRGGAYSSLEELKKAEDAIWGKAHKKGDKDTLKYYETVQITVEDSNQGEQVEPFYIKWNAEKQGYEPKHNSASNTPAYAAFPLKPTKEELKEISPNLPEKELRQHTRKVHKDVSFTLVITFPDKDYTRTEIEAALWAWETFGGIGARTRRGFGALSPEELSSADLPASNNEDHVKVWLANHLTNKDFVTNGNPPEGIPHLSQQVHICVATTDKDARIAWRSLIEMLASFRQASDGRPCWKTPNGRPKYGRSYWPEAESVRDLTGLGNRRKHRPLGHPQKFPRAAFGLPIEFHFPNEINERQNPTLQGAEKASERLASPIILRPLVCRDGQAIGLALLLDGYQLPPEGVILKEKSGRPHPANTQLVQRDLAHLPRLHLQLDNQDLQPDSQIDILQAFMNYLEGKKQ